MDGRQTRSERFDIDLAVQAKDYLRLVAVAEESEFPVHVVDLGSVSEAFRKKIEQHGAILSTELIFFPFSSSLAVVD